MQNIVVLASGRGSNLRAISAACAAERWPARIAAVVTNRPLAGALALAAELGITTATVDHTAHASRDAFDAALADCVDRFNPDWVVLAGFMRILTPFFVNRYEGRLLNIHPSLLPAFTGLQTHRRALEAGCKLAGATVHFVTEDLDHGPIIAQAAVPVMPQDDEATLSRRVLAAEHLLYPLALRWCIEGVLKVHRGVVVQTTGQSQLIMMPPQGADA